jgi:TPR repeat protein
MKYIVDIVKDYLDSSLEPKEFRDVLKNKFSDDQCFFVNFAKKVYFHGIGIFSDTETRKKYLELALISASIGIENRDRGASEIVGSILNFSASKEISDDFLLFLYDVISKSDFCLDSKTILSLGLRLKEKGLFKEAFVTIKNCKDNPRALCILGEMYEKGLGVDRDYHRSLDCYLDSAVYDYDHAWYSMCRIYSNPDFFDIYNPKKAVECMRYAYELEHPYAAFELGLIYFNGTLVEKDYEMALCYFELVDDEFNPKHKAEALYLSSRIWKTGGFGVLKSYSMSQKYLKKAADFGHPEAELRLAELDLIKNIIG